MRHRDRAADLSLVAKIGRECGSNSTKRRALIIVVTQDDWIRLTWIVSTMRSSIIYIQSRKQLWRRDGIVLLLLFLQLCFTRKRWYLHVVSVIEKAIVLQNTEKCSFVVDWVLALTVICHKTFLWTAFILSQINFLLKVIILKRVKEEEND